MSKKKRAGKSSPSASSGPEAPKGLTRRGFLGSSAAAGGVALAAGKVQAASPKTLPAKKASLTLTVNGKQRHLQAEFVKLDALQCGFCTPGMVMACKTILDEHKSPDLVTIKKGLRGNICRCGTYPRIFAAVQAASKQA